MLFVVVVLNSDCDNIIMAEKRKRGQNFTAEDKGKLIKLLLEHKNTILNKKTDGSTNEAKNTSWIEVTNAYNASGSIYRSKDSLMKVWEKLKSDSKLYYSSTRRSATQTGGGPSCIKTDPILEQVCNIMGRGCTGITGVKDSDADFAEPIIQIQEPLPKLICVGDDEQLLEIEIEDINLSTPLPEEPKPKNTVEITTPQQSTPLWSRRRPASSQPNERTELVGNLCSSFKDVNSKKEEIEALKKKLLEDEINFKRKLYDLQLQVAARDVEIKAKDLEIKEEVLRQIKGGGLALQNLFGMPKKD